MNTFGNKTKINPRDILFSFEEDYEREISTVHAIISTAKELAVGVIAEAKPESNGNGKFPTKGSIEFTKQVQEFEQTQKEKTEVDRKKAFYQALQEEQARAQKAGDKLFEEEINDIATNLPTEQKNQLLHYQASYKDRSIYQRAELRKKLIEEKKKAEKQQEEASKASTKAQGKFNMGENELGKGGENFGHFTRATG